MTGLHVRIRNYIFLAGSYPFVLALLGVVGCKAPAKLPTAAESLFEEVRRPLCTHGIHRHASTECISRKSQTGSELGVLRSQGEESFFQFTAQAAEASLFGLFAASFVFLF